MGTSQQFSLRWNNYLSHITGAFDSLRSDEDLVDVTLSCEGKRIRAHKMLLSACSTYFRDLFKENPCQHPVVIFRNVKFEDLVALVDFMYQGEVNVVQEQLGSFLTTAELLAVQGLSEGGPRESQPDTTKEPERPESPIPPPEPEVQMTNNGHSQKQKAASSPVSFFPVEASEPPSAKRRKWSGSVGTVSKSSKKEEERRAPPSPDPVEIIPVVQNLKMELPDYSDHNQDSYGDSNPGTSAGVEGGKQEPPDLFGSGSRDATVPPPADSLAPPDLSQMLPKPGTSGEGPPQDSLQALQWKSNKPPQFSCKTCGKVFFHRDSLTHHKSSHQGQTVCPICLKVFSRIYTMKCHISTVHRLC